MSLVSTYRKFIPLEVRKEIKHIHRQMKDIRQRIHFERTNSSFISDRPIRLVQPILRGNFHENKIKNLIHGCHFLSANSIGSQKYWSFWHRVGRPSSNNGFYKGRNLVNGEISAQVGGGLCQLSSIIYHLSLIAGLQIIERHAHSVDLYEEHKRFTPLGADATVVWGSKDLRLYNPYDFAVSLFLDVQGDVLIGEINGEQVISPRTVLFKQMPLSPHLSKVDTLVDDRVVTSNTYIKKPLS